MEVNMQNRLIEANMKQKCKFSKIQTYFLEPEWKMKKFQNISNKVSESMKGAPLLSNQVGAIVGPPPHAGYQNL